MATALDHAWGMKREVTYGTALTVDRFYPYLDGCKFDWNPRPRQGMGVLGGAGRRTDLGSRRFLPTGQGTLTTKVELESKALGVLLDVALGVSTVTVVTGGTQQNFHTGVANLVLPSATIQNQKIRNDGTAIVETYAGCTATKITLEQEEDAIPTIEVEWDTRSYTTATGAATPAYATTPTLFDAYQATVGYAGTLTAPTTTAIASGLTASTLFRSWKIELDQAAAVDRWVLNGGVRGQPTVGKPEWKWSAGVELNDTVLTAALTAGTKSPWYVTYVTTEALGGGFTTLQVVAGQVALTKGLPEVKPGEAPTVFDVEGDVTNDGTNRDVQVVYRTTDTAL